MASEPRMIDDRARRPGYGLVLGLLVGTIFLGGLTGTRPLEVVGALLLASATLLAILFVSGASRRTLIVVTVALVASVALATAAMLSSGNASAAGGAEGLIVLTIAAVGPFLIGRDLYRQGSVTIQTVLGAVSVYLLIGLFFAVLFSMLVVFSATTPFGGAEAVRALDLYYYSFVTITTLGLGDLVPKTDLARVLTIVEALLGQLYLVTVLALLVGKMSGGRREPLR